MERNKAIIRTLTYFTIIMITGFLLVSCYCGTVPPSDINWTNTASSDLDEEPKVKAITEGGQNIAYRGEELLISIEPDKIILPVTIELIDSSNYTTVIVEDYSGSFPFSWVIPENFPTCESYRIVINNLYYKDSLISHEYSEEFAILANITSGLSDITVSSKSISIVLTDNGSVVDGDAVLISLNDSVLNANHVLLGSPGTSMSLNLITGTNILTITAVNEGSVSPNTAQITFTDVIKGESVQQWRLNIGETGTLIVTAQ